MTKIPPSVSSLNLSYLTHQVIHGYINGVRGFVSLGSRSPPPPFWVYNLYHRVEGASRPPGNGVN